jgi:hypothetical protein
MAGSANATGHFHIDGAVILKGLGPQSVNHGGEPCRLILAQGLQSFKLHVTALQRPLVVLFEHHGTDQSKEAPPSRLAFAAKPHCMPGSSLPESASAGVAKKSVTIKNYLTYMSS